MAGAEGRRPGPERALSVLNHFTLLLCLAAAEWLTFSHVSVFDMSRRPPQPPPSALVLPSCSAPHLSSCRGYGCFLKAALAPFHPSWHLPPHNTSPLCPYIISVSQVTLPSPHQTSQSPGNVPRQACHSGSGLARGSADFFSPRVAGCSRLSCPLAPTVTQRRLVWGGEKRCKVTRGYRD